MTYGLAIFLRSGKLREVKIVVEGLTGVVEDGTFRLFNDFFERFAFETTARKQIVEVGHVGVEVLAVVELDGCCADDGLKGRGGVGKFHEFEFSVYGLCVGECAGGSMQ